MTKEQLEKLEKLIFPLRVARGGILSNEPESGARMVQVEDADGKPRQIVVNFDKMQVVGHQG